MWSINDIPSTKRNSCEYVAYITKFNIYVSYFLDEKLTFIVSSMKSYYVELFLDAKMID